MSKRWRNGASRILSLTTTLVLILILGISASRAQQSNPAYLGVQVVVNDQGTQVVQVIPGSPAEAAGFKPGDVIISINGQALSTSNTLDAILNRLSPDTLIQVGIVRGGQPMQLNVILGGVAAAGAATAAATITATSSGPVSVTLATPAPAATAESASTTAASPEASTLAATSAVQTSIVPATPSGSAAFLGVRLVDLRQGVQVGEVVPHSPADVGGLKVGDLILAVDNQPVQLAGQVQAILNQKPVGAPMVIRVQRGNQVQEITIHVGARPAGVNSAGTPAAVATAASSGAALVAGAAFPTFGFVARIVPDGLRVFSTTPGGPADQAGLRAGDLIIQVGTTTVNVLELTPVIVQLAAAQPVSLVVVRNGSSVTLQLAPAQAVTPEATGTPDQR